MNTDMPEPASDGSISVGPQGLAAIRAPSGRTSRSDAVCMQPSVACQLPDDPTGTGTVLALSVVASIKDFDKQASSCCQVPSSPTMLTV